MSYVACGGDDTTPRGADAGETGGRGGGFVVDAGASGSTAVDATFELALPGFADVVANLMTR